MPPPQVTRDVASHFTPPSSVPLDTRLSGITAADSIARNTVMLHGMREFSPGSFISAKLPCFSLAASVDPTKYFAPTYAESRERFLSLAHAAKCEISSEPITARGPRNEQLFIDFTILGNPNSRNVVLDLSGVHGVEASVGSAIQCAMLEGRPILAEDCAMVFAHSLNPWGAAHGRRVNEDNVDLNRNFIEDGRFPQKSPPRSEAVRELLNPRGKLGLIDPFYLEVACKIALHGRGALQNAVLAGQYEYPENIFYGGQRKAESLVILERFIKSRLQNARSVFAVDLHSGLGPYGGETLYVERHHQDPEVQNLSRALGTPVTPLQPPGKRPAWKVQGALCDEIPMLFPNAKVEWVLHELGTFNRLRVVNALRRENLAYRLGERDLDHPDRKELMEVSVPDSHLWRVSALMKGTHLLVQAGRRTFSGFR